MRPDIRGHFHEILPVAIADVMPLDWRQSKKYAGWQEGDDGVKFNEIGDGKNNCPFV